MADKPTAAKTKAQIAAEAEAQANQAQAITYSKPEGMSHVEYIRTLLAQKVPQAAILDGYVAARLPEYRANKAHAAKDDKKLASFLRKHAGNHLKLALADLNPMRRAERITNLAKREEKLKAGLASVQAQKSSLEAVAS